MHDKYNRKTEATVFKTNDFPPLLPKSAFEAISSQLKHLKLQKPTKTSVNMNPILPEIQPKLTPPTKQTIQFEQNSNINKASKKDTRQPTFEQLHVKPVRSPW